MTLFSDTRLRPPAATRLAGELRAIREPFRLAGAFRDLPNETSHRRSVVTIPGFGAGDQSMAPLRAYLRRIGHTARGWGLGTNTGDVGGLLPPLAEAVVQASTDAATRVDLVGWSLGGLLAREVARDHPHAVRRVVTYGTPVVGGPRYTRTARLYTESRLGSISQRIVEREATPIDVPVTAIYSRRDGIVAWQACIDPFDNDTEHVEVASTHLGMGLDPDVWRIVAERLTEDVPR